MTEEGIGYRIERVTKYRSEIRQVKKDGYYKEESAQARPSEPAGAGGGALARSRSALIDIMPGLGERSIRGVELFENCLRSLRSWAAV